MEEIFHKPAKKGWQSELLRAGVLNAIPFSDYSELRAFLPDPTLRNRISHYWILRWFLPLGVTYKPIEVLGDPVVTVFFSIKENFLYGITPSFLEYTANENEVIAGITFLPGGFRPYWGKEMSHFPRGRIHLNELLPALNNGMTREFLMQYSDEDLAKRMDGLLQEYKVEENPHLKTVQSIIQKLNEDPELRTVNNISKRFNISERTLQHIFKNEVGVNLKWIIKRTRLMEAINHSFSSNKPDWADIAYCFGYSSQAHFISEFKSVFSVSPGKYYKIIKEQNSNNS